MLNATVPGLGSVRFANLGYGHDDRQSLDVYRPKRAAAPMPVVVFFYGGDWQEGSKTDYRFAGRSIADVGFVAVVPDYRLYPTVHFPDFVRDGALAMRWVHDHIADYGGDSRRVYIMGHSAGAQIAALLTLDEEYLRGVGLSRSDIRAAALLSCPCNFAPPYDDRAVFDMKPADMLPAPAALPINFVDGHEPPIILITGLNDDVVAPANSQQLADKIRAAGGVVRLVTYPKLGHPTIALSLAWDFHWLAPTMKDATAFFREH